MKQAVTVLLLCWLTVTVILLNDNLFRMAVALTTMGQIVLGLLIYWFWKFLIKAINETSAKDRHNHSL